MAAHMYAVVYGPDWEDVLFFADATKARFKLLVQTVGCLRHLEPFHPILVEYVDDDSGVLARGRTYYVDGADATEQSLAAAAEDPLSLATLVRLDSAA
jgi:hypothetical protein